MNIRKDYGNEASDELFCYFMKVVLRFQKNGRVRIPVDITLGEPMDYYLKTAMRLIEYAEPPEITDLILQIEFENIKAKYELTKNQITLIVLIKNLTMHVGYDIEPISFLDTTANLWNDKANKFATKTFYPNLPLDIQTKMGWDKISEEIPDDFFELDNY